jgi:serine/threonine-protein kinase
MTAPIDRLNAALEGRYRIERELGEGGMATVYLADDLKHERNVALKVLKPELAAVVGAERFLAEIKTTANLQHPHILPLFDSGEADGFLFYVMPYVEGETLRGRLDREKQLPVDEAVRITTNLAEALDYAHRKGVIHRDIKPANVLLQEGKPVLADFGIALAVGAAGGGRLTETGLSLGTPHYMSPEQATGDQNVGPAADLYALACVLYEMLVGEPPFTGSTPQAVLGKIITGEAEPVTSQRHTVPANVEAAIARGLEKVPADRFPDAASFVRALADEGFRHGLPAATGLVASSGPWRTIALTLAPLLALALGVAGWALAGRDGPSAPSLTAEVAPGKSPVMISANGRTILGYEDGVWAVRSADDLAWRPVGAGTDRQLLAGIGTGSTLTVSPDGQWIAYVGSFGSGNRPIHRLTLDGGTPELLTNATRVIGGLHWASADEIYYSEGDRVMRITPSVGTSEEVFALPEDLSEPTEIYWPRVLPGGEGVLFQGRQREGFGSRIMIGDLRTGGLRQVAELGSRPIYTASGHLLYARQGTLVAVPLDPSELRLLGEPVTILVTNVSNLHGPGFSVSDDGTLIYPRAEEGRSAGGGFSWTTSAGEVTHAPPETFGGRQPRVSPDGRLVVYAKDGHLWILDLASEVSRQFTFEGENSSPIWSPDGAWLYFLSERASTEGPDGFRKRSDGTGEAERLWSFSDEQALTSASSDGRWLVLHTFAARGRLFTFDLSAEEGAVPQPFLSGENLESMYEGALSPDGRWLAYSENVDGRQVVYARGFPEPSGLWRISTVGRSGRDAVWAPDGDAIYYAGAASILRTEVEVQSGVLIPGRTTVAFEATVPGGPGMDLDIHPDGDRVIVSGTADLQGRTNVLVTNFFDLLERRAPRR